MHQLNFTDHRRQLLENRYVYAVVSRRAGGLSIGINLNPDKACNFDCPYCQVDRTISGGDRKIDVSRLRKELEHLLTVYQQGTLWDIAPFSTARPEHQRLIDISFSGDGEPTICPDFQDAMALVIDLRQRFSLEGVSLNVFSNATIFQRRTVQEALEQLWAVGGMVWAKLDAGSEEWYRRVDGSSVPFQRVLDNIVWAARQHPIVIQSMFHRFDEEEPSVEEVQSWANRLDDIFGQGGNIDWIQIYTTARKPSRSDVLPLSAHRLEQIADAAREVVARRNKNTRITVSV